MSVRVLVVTDSEQSPSASASALRTTALVEALDATVCRPGAAGSADVIRAIVAAQADVVIAQAEGLQTAQEAVTAAWVCGVACALEVTTLGVLRAVTSHRGVATAGRAVGRPVGAIATADALVTATEGARTAVAEVGDLPQSVYAPTPGVPVVHVPSPHRPTLDVVAQGGDERSLVAVVRAVASSRTGAAIVLLGDGEAPRAVLREGGMLGVEVSARPFHHDRLPLTLTGHALVHPLYASVETGAFARHPLVLGAVAAGLPVLATAVGDHPAVLANGHGLVHDAGSVEALGDGIVAVLRGAFVPRPGAPVDDDMTTRLHGLLDVLAAKRAPVFP